MIIRKSSDNYDDDDKGNSSGLSIFSPKTILIFGIVLTAIGIVGSIYYGSQFIKEVKLNMNSPYTAVSPIKNVISVEFEIAFVVVMLVGFGLLSYGVVVTKFNKPLDFYPI
jgi:hypothetical protein